MWPSFLDYPCFIMTIVAYKHKVFSWPFGNGNWHVIPVMYNTAGDCWKNLEV